MCGKRIAGMKCVDCCACRCTKPKLIPTSDLGLQKPGIFCALRCDTSQQTKKDLLGAAAPEPAAQGNVIFKSFAARLRSPRALRLHRTKRSSRALTLAWWSEGALGMVNRIHPFPEVEKVRANFCERMGTRLIDKKRGEAFVPRTVINYLSLKGSPEGLPFSSGLPVIDIERVNVHLNRTGY